MLRPFLLLVFSALASRSFATLLPSRRACTIIFDGRIPPETQPADFDAETSVYDNENVKGENQTWAEIIKFPDVEPSLFDAAVRAKPFEITISDKSIFKPGSGLAQTGFRRSECLPGINNGTDITVQGITTVHWSLRTDPSRQFNLSHEHQMNWHENLDFTTDQFMLKTGATYNQTFVESRDRTLRLEGRQTTKDLLFSTPFDDDVWHNFAVTIGWETNNFTIYYSKGSDPLQLVNATTNDNSGGGQQHFGFIRLPTGDADLDVLHEGYQGTGLNEGLILGGIFIEDSGDGCVTLS